MYPDFRLGRYLVNRSIKDIAFVFFCASIAFAVFNAAFDQPYGPQLHHSSFNVSPCSLYKSIDSLFLSTMYRTLILF